MARRVAGSAAASDDVSGAMLEPSLVNTPWARAVAVTAAVGATAWGSTLASPQVATFVHLVAFALALGTNAWTTFVAGLTMFKNMPRQMFGRVQSKLFPQYFAITTASNLLMLATYALAPAGLAAAPAALCVSAVANLANALLVEPKATRLMFERYDIENKPAKTAADEADIKRLYKQFGAWHGVSSLANLVVLACTAAYGWTLAGRLTLLA